MSADPATIAAVVAVLRVEATRHGSAARSSARRGEHTAALVHRENRIALTKAADALLAANPDVEAWAMELAEAVLLDRELHAEHAYAQSAPPSGRERAIEQVKASLAAIVRSKLGGGR